MGSLQEDPLAVKLLDNRLYIPWDIVCETNTFWIFMISLIVRCLKYMKNLERYFLEWFICCVTKRVKLLRWSIQFLNLFQVIFSSEISFSWLINLRLKTTDNIFQSVYTEIVPREMKIILGSENERKIILTFDLQFYIFALDFIFISMTQNWNLFGMRLRDVIYEWSLGSPLIQVLLSPNRLHPKQM